MFHFFDAITNTRGDALTGFYVKAIDPTSLDIVAIYADANATPIVSVSGIDNAAEVDGDGNASFYIASGTYHLDIYATDATTFVKRVENIPMVTADDIITATQLAGTGGAALVGKSSSGTVQDAINRIGTFVGYDSGNGGIVSQTTSKSTAVTINKPCGQIITTGDAMGAGVLVTFTVNNTNVASTDTVRANLQSGNATPGTYRIWAEGNQANAFKICIENRSAGSLSEALVINFAVTKGVNA
jgi:hypothetical protein